MLDSMTSDLDHLTKAKWMAEKEASDLHDIVNKLTEERNGYSDCISSFQVKHQADQIIDLQ